MIKFNKHNVTNTETKAKARVHYSVDNRIDNRPCVTLYGKDFNRDLGSVFDGVVNNSDPSIDYSENSKMVLFQDHPEYEAAREAAIRHLNR